MQVIKFWFSLLVLAVSTLAAEAPTELQIETTYLPNDCSAKAEHGDQIKVHYTGKLFSNGEKFDSSVDRGQPFGVKLGAGQVIKGWDEGLKGMCVNEKRTLTIPPNMAYGSRAIGPIPANSALVFDVELLSLESSRKDEL